MHHSGDIIALREVPVISGQTRYRKHFGRCFDRVRCCDESHTHAFFMRPSLSSSTLCNISDQASLSLQDAERIDIVYSICGSNRKEELLRSLTSLAVLISAAEAADFSTTLVYNVHLITDGSIGFGDMPAIALAKACYYLHEPNSRATPLFAPCSTQRLYLHEHVDFNDVDQVYNN